MRELTTSTMDDNELTLGFNAFSNPASDYINIEIQSNKDYEFTSLNLNGQAMLGLTIVGVNLN